MKKDKIRVLLIHPEISRTKYNFAGVIENECLELEYISALLKESAMDVCLYDGQVEQVRLEERLSEYRPDVVYICGRTRQENFMLEYAKMAKDTDADTITMIGGLHAALCYERMYRDFVDYIFTDFEIFKIAEIIEHHFKGKKLDLSSLSGICYKEGAQWKAKPPKAFDINKLPLPDRSYFYEHPANYRYLELEHAAWVRTAYSCPYRCKFCHRNRMNVSTYSSRNIEAVVEEIAGIPDENIYIVDDDFLYDEERLWTFTRLIREKNVKKNYICYGRADFIATHEDIMRAFKEIGLYYVLVGLEAISDDKLNGYNKKCDVWHNERSIELCHELGIHLMGMFILDLDYTSKDFKNLYKWIWVHQLKHVALSIFTPEMGLETYNAYKEKLITNNPSHWDYLHLVAKPEKLSVKAYYFQYYKILIRLFLKAQREGVYDFIDYGDYIRSFAGNILKKKRKGDDA